MRILITNDDGIRGEGLLHLTKWAQGLGQVVVAAPLMEQSAKSHTIQIHGPFRAERVEYLPGVESWAVDSSPADCVRLMVLGMKKEFDLVLSGINRGLNVGSDIMYSGTVAAVFEAGALGIPALAVSTEPASISTAWQELDRVWQFLQDHKLLERHSLYNINIPRDPGAIRITTQGGPYYSDDFTPQEEGMFLPVGKPVYAFRDGENLDTESVLTRREISLMPLTTQRVDRDVYQQLRQLNG